MPGSELAMGSIGRFAPGSELARERKGCESKHHELHLLKTKQQDVLNMYNRRKYTSQKV